MASPITADSAGSWLLGDRSVQRIGFGAMRLTGSGVFDRGTPSDRGRAISVLRRAVELGVNHIDTAAFYFSSLRSANELINRALAPYPDDLVIVTKVGPGRDPSGEWLPWARPEQLRGQVEENLRQLGRDHLDVVNLRAYGSGPIGEHFGALAELRQAGLIRHLGLSAVRADQLAEARAIAPVVCVQNPWGLGFRSRSDDLVRLCGTEAIAFVPFFAIAGQGREAGFTGGGTGTDGGTATGGGTGTDGGTGTGGGDEVRAVADSHGATTAQVRLAWTLQRGPHILAIPGTGDPDHLTANVAAGALRLTADDLARLDTVHKRDG